MSFRWRALGVVLGEAWPAWIALGGIGSAGLIGWATSTGVSASIRYASTILQILGLLTVALGLHHMRELFGRPTVTRRAMNWFGRLARVFRPPEPITLQASVSGVAAVTGEARVRRSAGAGASVEQRLEVLEGNLNQLQDELDTKIGDVRSKIGQLEESLRRERDERRTADDRTSRQIEEVAIGGLHLEIVGLLWLTLGVLGASVPDEVAMLVSFIRR